MNNLEIKQGENKFCIGNDKDHALTEITYRFVDNNEINIDHTDVSDELGGQGAGKKLVKAVVERAHEDYLKIIASCSFAKHMLGEEDSYQDVYPG